MKFWIGSGGSFATDANWSTSSGGAANTTAPGAADIATFDNGGAGVSASKANTDCIISATVSVAGIDIKSTYTSAITQSSGIAITIGTSHYSQAGGTFSGGDASFTDNGTFTLSGGTFTAGTGTHTFASTFTKSTAGTANFNSAGTTQIAGSFVLTGGTFISPSDLRASGDWYHSAGTFTTTVADTITFMGVTRTMTIPNDAATYDANIVINKNDTAALELYNSRIVGCCYANVPQTLTITGTLTLTDGRLNTGIIITPSFSNSTNFDGGNGLLEVNGAATSTITNSNAVTLPPTKINGANTVIAVSSTGPITFSGATTFNQGTVDFGSTSSVTFSSTFINSGASTTAGGGNYTVTGAATFSGGTFTAGSGTYTFSSTFTKSTAGTADFNSAGTTTMNGSFVVTGGTFVSPSDLRIAGVWYHPSGTFTTNLSDTVTFTGATATMTIPSDASTYNFNVVLNKTNSAALELYDYRIVGGYYTTVLQTLTINGTLTLTDGKINTGLLSAPGFSNSANFDGGSGTLEITGSSTSTITNSSAILMPNFKMNGANTVLAVSSTGAITFGTATFVQGTADFGSTSSLTFSGAFTNSGSTITAGTGGYNYNSTATFSGGTFTAGSGTYTFGSTFTKSTAGTADFNSAGTTTMNGSFVVTGGTFVSPSDLRIAGVWYHSSGTFTTTLADTVTFTGATATMTIPSDASTYNFNMVINKTNTAAIELYDYRIVGGYYSYVTQTLTISGTLTLTDGKINTGILSAPSFSNSVNFDGGSGLLEITGASTSTITNTNGSSILMPGLKLNGANSALAVSSTGTITFGGVSTFVQGTADFGSTSSVTFSSTFTNSGSSITSGTGNYTFSGTSIFSGGTFAVTTGTANYNFIGNATVSGGTFTASNGAYTFGSTFTVTSGTFTSGSGTLSWVTGNFTGGTVNLSAATSATSGTFTLAGATFTAPSGTLSVSGHWFFNSGTFNHNNGTVAMTAGGQYFNNPNGTRTYYNLTLNAANNGNINLNNNITVAHNFVMTRGYLDTTAVITLDGANNDAAFTHASTWNAGNNTEAGTVAVLDPTSNTILSGTRFPGLTLNNSSATVSISGSSTMTFGATVTLTAGTINWGGGAHNFSNFTVNGMTVALANVNYSISSALTISSGSVTAGSGTFTVSGTYTNSSSGTFTAGTGAISLATVTASGGTVNFSSASSVSASGDFTISGATVTAPATTFSESGHWFYNSGTFNHNNGTFVMAQGGRYFNNPNGTKTYYNLTINAANNANINMNNNITVVHNLNMTRGYFDSTATITIDSSNNDATFTHASTWNSTNANELTTIILADPTSNTITSGASFGGLTVNNAGATVTISGSSTAAFRNTVTLTAGTVNWGSGTHTFTNLTVNGMTTTLSNSNYTVSGTLTVSSGSITAGSGTYTLATVTASGGTLNLGSGTVNVSSDFTISGATLTSTSGVLSVTGHWFYNSGTFNHNNGTLAMVQGGRYFNNPNSSKTYYNLTFNAANNANFNFNNSITVAHNLTLTRGYFDAATTITLDGANDDATFTHASTWNAGNNTDNGIVKLSDPTSNTINGGNFPNLTINNASAVVTLAGNTTMTRGTQNMIMSSGTLDLSGYNLSVNGTNGTFTLASGAVLKLQGGETLSTNASYPSFAAGSKIIYYGTGGSYTLKNYTYTNATVEISGGAASVFTAGGNITATNLMLNSGILSLAGNSLTVTTTFSNTGTLRLQGGESTFSLATMDTDSGTVEYTGTSNYASLKAGNTYNNLSFASTGAGTWTLNANLTVNGNLAITAGTLLASSNTLNVTGNWSNSGTFTAGTSTVNLNGNNQTITGTNTFYKLSKVTTSAKTLTFPSGVTTTVSNKATLTGQSGNLLSLHSSAGGSPATLAFSGKALQFVDLKDLSISTTTLCLVGCTDGGGNNNNWTFTNPANLTSISYNFSDASPFTYDSTYTEINASSNGLARLKSQGPNFSPLTEGAFTFNKRKFVTITNTNAAQTFFQVQINVTYDSDMQADFDDIRFTSADGTTQIPYWLQEKTDSSTATFWVKIPDLAAGTTSIYMYYGSPTATSVSSGSNTFVFFDDFSTAGDFDANGNYNGWSKWDGGHTSAPTPNIVNGVLQLSGASKEGGVYYSTTSFTDGVFEAKMLLDTRTGNGQETHLFVRMTPNANPANTTAYRFGPYWGSAADLNIGSEPGHGNAGTYAYDYGTGIWRTISFAFGGTALKGSINGTQYLSTTSSSYASGKVGFGLDSIHENTTSMVSKFDDARVRKYAATAPTASFFTEENSAANTYATPPPGGNLTGWTKRKAVVISSASALTNYAVKVVVALETGMKADFADVRFTTSDGNTLVDYWLESSGNNSATFWVEVPSIAAGNTSPTLYLYYGNSGATSISSGADTFIYFDDFNDDNTTGWSVSGGTISVVTKQMRVGGSGGFVSATLDNSSIADAVVEADVVPYDVSGNNMNQIGIQGRNTNISNMYTGGFDLWEGGDTAVIGKEVGGGWTLLSSASNVNTSGTSYKFSFSMFGTALNFYVNDVLKNSITDSSLTSAGMVGFNYDTGNSGATDYALIDNFRVRKSAGTEPTVAIGPPSNSYTLSAITLVPNVNASLPLYTDFYYLQETMSGDSTGSITYQLCVDTNLDGTVENCYYHNGTTWATASTYSESNNSVDINAFASTFTAVAGTGKLYFKGFLTSDGTQPIELDNLLVAYAGNVINFASDQNVAENAGTITITTQLSGGATASSDITIPYTVSGTATAGSVDHNCADGNIVITTGNSSGSITCSVADDGLDEDNETILFTMGTPSSGSAGSTTTQTVTIIDNDNAPTMTINDVTTGESGTATFTATLSAASSKTITVDYATANGTALAGSDYTATLGTLTFTPGQTTKSIVVTISSDTIDESDETYAVNLSNATNASISDSAGLGVISDDDASPSVQWSAASQASAGESGTLTVTAELSAVSGLNVSIPFTLTGTATGTTDYTISASPLTIIAGSTTASATITIVGDVLDEADETVILTIGNATNATKGVNTVHTATITDDDDTPTVQWSTGSQSSSNENNASTMTVTAQLSAASGLDVTVPFTVTGSATGTTDYTITSSPITITAGATSASATITIVGDALNESDETVILTLGNPTNATKGATTAHTATITDDDSVPTVQWTASSQSSTGESGTLTVTAELSAASGLDVTVPFTLTGTATGSGTDYTITASPLTITAGSTTTTATITIVGDTLDETDETVILTLGNPTNATKGATTAHTATLTDDDGPPTVQWTAATQSSSDETDTSTMTVTAELSAASGLDVTIPFTVTGTATGTTDYTISSSPLTIAAGATTTTATITIVGDYVDETNETIILTMGNPTNTTKGATTVHTATITDDDTRGVTLTASGGSTNVTEGNVATDSYTVVLNSEPTASVTITASPNAQVSITPATLTFTTSNWNVAQTITVSSVNDNISESAHTGKITHAASGSSDYNGLSIADLTVNVTDNDSEGVSIIESGGSTNVAEGGSTDSYTIVLTSEPTDDVVIALTPNSQITTSSSAVTFTSANWSTPQTITVTAVDDRRVEGSHSGLIQHVATSSDSYYHHITINNVSPVITDNDSASILISETGGSTAVSESTVTDTYTVVLNSEPSHDVLVTLGVGDGLSASTSVLTFTSLNWNTPQTVIVSAVDDSIAKGILTGTITHTSSSTDTNYNALTLNSISVQISDNDMAAVTVSKATLALTEGGSSASYTVVLNSQPTDTVTIAVTSSSSQISATPASLAFTTSNWNIPKTVTVSAVDDSIAENTATYTLTHTIGSTTTDNFYKIVTVNSVGATVTDNDTANVTITSSTKSSTLTTTEGGATSTLSAVLTSKPTSDVTIAFSTDANLTLSSSSLIFTADNWNISQTLTVSATDDTAVEGDHSAILTPSISTSDAFYKVLPALAVYTVNITDNDAKEASSGGNSGSGKSGKDNTISITSTRTEGIVYVTHAKENVMRGETSTTTTTTTTTNSHTNETTTQNVTQNITQIAVDTSTITIPVGTNGTSKNVTVTSEVSSSISGDEVILIGSSHARREAGMIYIIPRSEVTHDIDLSNDSDDSTSMSALGLGLADVSADLGGVLIYGHQAGDRLGEYIATGDVNGDGVPEYLIAAPGAGLYGIIYVLDENMNEVASIYGSADQPLSSIILSQLIGGSTLDINFGPNNHALNADLSSVSALSSNQASGIITTLEGSAQLEGAIDLATISTDTRLGSGNTYQSLIVSDVNGDGINDLIASTMNNEVVIFFGPISSASDISYANANVVITGEGGNFGQALTSADINNDGKMDIICGAPALESNYGVIYIIYGHYFWKHDFLITDEIDEGNVTRITGSVEDGRIGSDFLIQSESNGSYSLYTPEGSDSALQLTLTSTKEINEFVEVGGRSGLFGCTLVAGFEEEDPTALVFLIGLSFLTLLMGYFKLRFVNAVSHKKS